MVSPVAADGSGPGTARERNRTRALGITDVVARLRTRYWLLKSALYYRVALRSFGPQSLIAKPILITGGRWITIGRKTWIRNGARLEVFKRPGEPEPRLSIGNNVLIEQNAHIVCSTEVVIGDHVTIAARCAIVDTGHPMPGTVGDNVGYTTEAAGRVEIGRGTMLGVGAVVLPGVRIGANCMIGANSVVTHDLPDGVVAAGAPARVLRVIEDEA